MKQLFYIVCVAALIALVPIAYIKGRNDVWIMELKVYEANLVAIQNYQTNTPLVLSDFVKGRYYYLANIVPARWRPSADYGPISTNWPYFVIGKGPTRAENEYRIFTSKGR